eukprot:RCo007490
MVVGIWLFVVAVSVLKGDRASPSVLAVLLGVTQEEWARSLLHWALLGLTFLTLMAMSAGVSRTVLGHPPAAPQPQSQSHQSPPPQQQQQQLERRAVSTAM